MSSPQKIEGITVNGSNKIFGGFIYYINFSNFYNEKPNEIQINIVSENGKYSFSNPNLVNPNTIKIGDKEFKNFFLVKTKERLSSQGKMGELYYIDASFVLDKIFVGLIGKHGWTKGYEKLINFYKNQTFYQFLSSKQNLPSSDEENKYERKTKSFWLVGRQFHPCDENLDNSIDPKENGFDFCDPCPSCPQDKYESRCKELSYSQIFEVAYPLRDLLEVFKIDQPVNITIETPAVEDDEILERFYRNHFGTLREVLNAWANDLGFSWYFDSNELKIKFIDLSSNDITFNAQQKINAYKESNQNPLISFENGEASETTCDKRTILWYERGGEKKSYTCSKATTFILNAVYGNDFIDDANVITSAILKNYNPIFRQAFWLRKIYGFTEAKKTAEYISSFDQIPSEKETDEDVTLDDKYTIQPVGNMKILGVISNPPLKDGEGNSTEFQKKYKDKYAFLYKQLTDYDKARFNAKNGYFVVAYCDDKELDKSYEYEDQLFEFLGRFYVNDHLFRLCGITGNDEFIKENTNIETPDGSAQIFSKKDSLASNPMSRFKYYNSGYLGCVTSTGNRLSDSTLIDSKEKARFDHSAIVLEREPLWFPAVENFQNNYNDYITSKYSDLEWSIFGQAKSLFTTINPVMPYQWLKDALNIKNDGAGKIPVTGGIASKIYVFTAFPGEFNVDIQYNVDHPIDKVANNRRSPSVRPGGKYSFPIPIGLIRNRAVKISISGDPILGDIYTPPNSFVEPKQIAKRLTTANQICKPEGFRVPAYRAFLTQSFDQKISLPKIQTGIHNLNETTLETSRKLDVSYHVLTDDNFKSYQSYGGENSAGSRGAYGCTPDLTNEKFKKIIETYEKNLISATSIDKSLNLVVKGFVPISYSEIREGLTNYTLSVGEDGISSNITYETKRAKQVSNDLVNYQLYYQKNKSPRKTF